MKQKFLISKENDQKKLIIKEFAELDKEKLSLLCEEEYDNKIIKSAILQGKETLIAELRTNNMYPPGVYAEKIAQAVIDIFGSKDSQSIELSFNDIDLLIKEQSPSENIGEIESIADDIDELIGDDLEKKLEKKNTKKDKKNSIKIAKDKGSTVVKEDS
ncbi:MAG: hypothetical protein QNK40_09030 [Desulfobacterales bacterium]|nr:hypothetical protein [Desulfobacterales bacterium]MDX2509289.1 hypothetical protein [Desulfobacterales bacterium]